MNKLLEYFKGDELAANVIKSKYLQENEDHPDLLHRRMSKEFYRVDKKYQDLESDKSELSEYGQEREDLTDDSIFGLFKDFNRVVPQGSVMATLGTNQISSLSNCYVNESPLDSYSSILRSDADLVHYFVRRGGVGLDISNLRPNGVKTNNAAKSSTGAVSFMERFSNTTREVAMNGRRAALMITMAVNHTDILDFIQIKRDLKKVTGANISIRLNDQFMEAVEADEDYILTFPVDRRVHPDRVPLGYGELVKLEEGLLVRRIRAKEYWDEIVKSARDMAEPGLMFWNNVIDNDPASVYSRYAPISSNPCGEQFLNANDSCRLIAVNLFSFVKHPFTVNSKIDYDKVYEVFYETTRLGDALVDLEIEHIDRIIDKIVSDPEPEYIKRLALELWNKSREVCKSGRRMGLGITALGDMIAALNIKYDSDEGLKTAGLVMKKKMEAELDCLIDLARLRGPFEGWDRDKEYSNDTSKRLLEEGMVGTNSYFKTLLLEFPDQAKRMYLYGRRSVNFSTIAPTGSLSILTQTSSGCEPLFMPYYMRRKKINPSEEGVRIDFTDDMGDKWQEFPVLHPKFINWCESKNSGNSKKFLESLNECDLKALFEKSPWFGSTANDIDWVKRVEMQAVLQRYTSNSISSTVNLPEDVSYEEVGDIYMQGWKHGLKGLTVYREGSRSGVLVSNEPKKLDIYRGIELPCQIFHNIANGEKFTTIIGLKDNTPFEIFVVPINMATKYDKGIMVKEGDGDYTLKCGDTDEYGVFKDVTSQMNGEYQNLTRMWSLMLKHGVHIVNIVEQIKKASESVTALSKVVARVLSIYIPDGTQIKLTCDECGSTEIVFEEGCSNCKNCGSSKCS